MSTVPAWRGQNDWLIAHVLLTWNQAAFLIYCVFGNEEGESKCCVYVACIHMPTVWYDASSCSESGRAVVGCYSLLVKLKWCLVLFLMALDFLAGCLGGLIDRVARMHVYSVNSPQGIT